MAAGTFGTYRLDGELGRGGMGVVHRAFDLDLERYVALKVLPAALSADEEFRERFRREARAAARLTAPEVVPIHRFGEVDGQLFLDMRLVEGRDLAVLLRSEGPLSPERAVAVITRVAAALDAAKAQGLLHRDVKPANILVESGLPELVYLGDFGIARSIEPTDRSVLTTTGGAIGTLDYMAPERFTGAEVDHGVDVYALACVLFECLTGRKPFAGDGALAMMHAHCYTDPPLLDGPLGPVIARGMAKDPAARPASAGELATLARDALGSTTVIDRPTGVVEYETAVAHAPLTFAPLPPPAERADSGPHRVGPQSGPHPVEPTRPELQHTGPQHTGPQHTDRPTGPQPAVVPKPRSAARWAVPLAVFLAVAAVAVVLFAPRGNTVAGSPVAAGAGLPAACPEATTTLTVGVILPVSGQLAPLSAGMVNSARLAVEQANERCAAPGHRFVLDVHDDQLRPEVGAREATALAADPSVVGVVGTLNSSIAKATIPVLAEASIAQVSPSNTAPELTRGDGPDRDRMHDNYFRVCVTDDLQGPFAAEYLAAEGTRQVAVVSDSSSYGSLLTAGFLQRAQAEGLTVVSQDSVPETATDFTAVVAKLALAKPEAVYYGGQYPQGAPFSKQLAAAGLTVPVVGGDGLFSEDYLARGGRDGDLATAISAPPDSLASAADFRTAYDKRGYREPYGTYGPLTYDATNVIIAAAAKTVASGGTWRRDLRPALLQAISAHDTPGATGPISFDGYGDTTNGTMSIYRVAAGKWTVEKTGEVER